MKITPADKLVLASRILCCPDCELGLSSALTCTCCGRSLAPKEDSIISALPRAMEKGSPSKEKLQELIDGVAQEDRAANIVLYERAFHDEQARYYDKLFTNPLPLDKYYERLIRQQVHSYVSQQPFVVDLCCGTGKSSLPLLERGLSVVGLDVSREMLRSYKQRCAEKGYNNLLLVQADATRPPLRNESCSTIIVIGGLHHIQKRTECVNSWCNSIAGNGLLILHEPLKTGRTSKLAILLDNLYALTDPPRILRAIGRRIGLSHKTDVGVHKELATPAFTPYERPFVSSEELLSIIPKQMKTITLRSQGLLSFKEFSPFLQSRIGMPLALLIVGLDDWLCKSERTNWSGDALFAVFKKIA